MKAYLTIIILAITFNTFSLGWSDWNSVTPGGNTGNNYSGNNIELNINGKTFDGVQRLYFYKNHIIGELGEDVDNIDEYFIVDENQNVVYRFKDKTKWESEIKEKSLSPSFWTRWYTTDWYEFDDWGPLFLFYFIILIPLIGLYFYILLKAIQKERFKFFKPYTTISTIITVLILLELLLEIYPQSI